jgi:hypothetical protein
VIKGRRGSCGNHAYKLTNIIIYVDKYYESAIRMQYNSVYYELALRVPFSVENYVHSLCPTSRMLGTFGHLHRWQLSSLTVAITVTLLMSSIGDELN